MKSFNFGVDFNTTVTGATNLKTWSTTLGQNFWQVNTGTSSTYNIEGFRNINVYGIDVVGSIQTVPSSLYKIIVKDWLIDVTISGTQDLVGGNITTSPNFYGVNIDSSINKTFQLGRYSTSVKFASPFMSTKNIQLGQTFASGNAFQDFDNVTLRWKMNFVVFYKFEEE